ncbi:MAG: hypothetical protein AAF711_08270 [Planctomycetota bacterium]
MNCPKCGHSRSKVVSSPLPRRHRKCLSKLCGHTWVTVEIPEEDSIGMDAKARKVLRVIREAADDAELHICKKRA